MVTLIEGISAEGKSIPPTVIIEGSWFMEDWSNENQDGSELLLVSDSGYTNEELGIRWLDHFISYSGAGPKAPMRLLLFDGHSSHTTDDFRLKCWDNNIVPYEFLSHMTHLMQPCDVGLFQPEKHYHNKAVKAALRGGATSYNVASFLDDLMEIRDQALKPQNIISTFVRLGIYPPNPAYVLKQMEKYNNRVSKAKAGAKVALKGGEPSLPQLPLTRPATPTKPRDSVYGLIEWGDKIKPLMSSPSQRNWESFERGTKSVLHNAQITEYENLAIREQQTKQDKRGGNSKRKLRKGGAMTAAEARRIKQEKAEKRVKEDMQKVMTKDRKAFNSHKNQAFKSGVEWRKREKENKQAVKDNKIPPWVDLIIRDPWEEWKEAHPDWVKQDEEKKRRKKEQAQIDPRLLINSTVEAI